MAGGGGALEPGQAFPAGLSGGVPGQHGAGQVVHRDDVAVLAGQPIGVDRRRPIGPVEAAAGLDHPGQVVPGPDLVLFGRPLEPPAGGLVVLPSAEADQGGGADEVLGVGVTRGGEGLDLPG